MNIRFAGIRSGVTLVRPAYIFQPNILIMRWRIKLIFSQPCLILYNWPKKVSEFGVWRPRVVKSMRRSKNPYCVALFWTPEILQVFFFFKKPKTIQIYYKTFKTDSQKLHKTLNSTFTSIESPVSRVLLHLKAVGVCLMFIMRVCARRV